MMKEYPLQAVGGSSDQSDVRKAIRDLRHFVRLGKLAEHVLEEIESRGYYSGLVPSVTSRSFLPGIGFGTTDVAPVKMYRAAPIERSMAPSFTDLHIVSGDVDLDQHGPNTFKCVSFSVTGTGFQQDRDGPGVVRRRVSRKIGYVRLLKSRQLRYQVRHGASIYTLSTSDSASGARFIDALAIDVIEAITVSPPDISEMHLMKELRERSVSWLVEEGHAMRLAVSMRDQAVATEVMSS